MLLYIVYGILFVDTVDTKIKAHKALNAMFVETVDTTVKTHPHIQCYLCRRCRYKTHPHIPAHNFLNIQPVFNP